MSKWCSALCQPPFKYCRRICVENAAVVLNLTVFFSLLCSDAGRAPGLQRPKKFDISSVTNTCAYSFNWDFAIVLTFLTIILWFECILVPSIHPQHQFLGSQGTECNQDSFKGNCILVPANGTFIVVNQGKTRKTFLKFNVRNDRKSWVRFGFLKSREQIGSSVSLSNCYESWSYKSWLWVRLQLPLVGLFDFTKKRKLSDYFNGEPAPGSRK